MDKNEPWGIMKDFLSGVANGIVGGFRDIARMIAGQDTETEHAPGSVNNPEVKTPYPGSPPPTMKWKKNDIKKWMVSNGVEYNSGDTKKDLIQKIGWS